MDKPDPTPLILARHKDLLADFSEMLEQNCHEPCKLREDWMLYRIAELQVIAERVLGLMDKIMNKLSEKKPGSGLLIPGRDF